MVNKFFPLFLRKLFHLKKSRVFVTHLYVRKPALLKQKLQLKIGNVKNSLGAN